MKKILLPVLFFTFSVILTACSHRRLDSISTNGTENDSYNINEYEVFENNQFNIIDIESGEGEFEIKNSDSKY